MLPRIDGDLEEVERHRTFGMIDKQGRLLIPRGVRTAAVLETGMRVEMLLVNGALVVRPIQASVAAAVAAIEEASVAAAVAAIEEDGDEA